MIGQIIQCKPDLICPACPVDMCTISYAHYYLSIAGWFLLWVVLATIFMLFIRGATVLSKQMEDGQ